MIEFIQMGGVFMWPILLCTLLVVALSGRSAFAARAGGTAPSDVDSVLFWGLSAAVLGVLGTLAGVLQMASAIERAGSVQASTVWSGIKVTLTTSIAGMGTLLLALLLWITLRAVLVRRMAAQ